jgi:hypothetical protein
VFYICYLFPPLAQALFGLQGLSSSASLFSESAIGIDADEVNFLLSAIWDKVKLVKKPMPLGSIALGLQGISLLKDPIAENLRQYMYIQLLKMDPAVIAASAAAATAATAEQETKASAVTTGKEEKSAAAAGGAAVAITLLPTTDSLDTVTREILATGTDSGTSLIIPKNSAEAARLSRALDVVSAVRSLQLNSLPIPPWLAAEYAPIELNHGTKQCVMQSRADKLVAQRYAFLHPTEKFASNILVDGFRLDMCFPEIKLNVELDGPTHRYPARLRFDRARDQYLQSKDFEVLMNKLQLNMR